VNQLCFENTNESSYATLFFAEYDDDTRQLRYTNCGQYCPLLLRSDGTLERLDSTGTVLGLFREWNPSMAECELLEGDTLALYSDGVTECFYDAGDEFGEQRLVEALQQHRELPSRELLASVIDELRRFSSQEQHDDITLVIAKGK